MKLEPMLWREVPTGARVISETWDGSPEGLTAGPWIGPTRRVFGDGKIVTVDPDKLVTVLVPEEPDVIAMFIRAGFTIEGVIACPPQD